MADLTGYSYNAATLLGSQQRLAGHVRQQLVKGAVSHFDETGLRIAGQQQWLHRSAGAVACNEAYTLLSVPSRRGQTTLIDSVFRACRNWTVHDCFSSYLAHGQGKMALCGAHLVRELQALFEQGRVWAKGMQTLLLALNEATRAGPLSETEGWHWRDRYMYWCVKGDSEERPPLVFLGPDEQLLNKRPKRTKGRNLLQRLVDHQGAVLAFAFEAGVGFTARAAPWPRNNEAERALRPAKIKQKVSGGFRTETGAVSYTRIAGFIATLGKQGRNRLDEISNVFTGRFQWAT